MNNTRKCLLQKLESIIGNYACNNDSNISPEKSIPAEPETFRYPITFQSKIGEGKTKQTNYSIDEKHLLSGRYKFGTKDLLVMQALNQIITYLEDECALNLDDCEIPEGNHQVKMGKPDIGKVEMIMQSGGSGPSILYRVNGGTPLTKEEFKELYPNYKL